MKCKNCGTKLKAKNITYQEQAVYTEYWVKCHNNDCLSEYKGFMR